MKHAVSVSLGSSKRDKRVILSFLGEEIELERIGTDGDVARAIALFNELDGQVDALGVGGIDLGMTVAGRYYPLYDAQKLVAGVRHTPVGRWRRAQTHVGAPPGPVRRGRDRRRGFPQARADPPPALTATARRSPSPRPAMSCSSATWALPWGWPSPSARCAPCTCWRVSCCPSSAACPSTSSIPPAKSRK
jgi:hypothetical protein